VNALIGLPEVPHSVGRYPKTTDLFLLNGNPALPEVYFYASRFLPFPVELTVDDHGSDGEHPDSEIENVPIDGLAAPPKTASREIGAWLRPWVDLDQRSAQTRCIYLREPRRIFNATED
jgi:hypothetical protein